MGWLWKQGGTLSATPHRLSALTTCTRPETVKAMPSYIGAYKAISKVIKRCSDKLNLLNDMVGGRNGAERLVWTEPLVKAFEESKKALSSADTVTMPRSSDQLWIVCYGAVKDPGIGATLYVQRDSVMLVAGSYSAKLSKQLVGCPARLR